MINEHQARLNVTWKGENGDLPDPVDFDSVDAVLIGYAEEAIRGGDIPGIALDANVELTDFVIDRFPAHAEVPYNRLVARPKTPFGL